MEQKLDEYQKHLWRPHYFPAKMADVENVYNFTVYNYGGSNIFAILSFSITKREKRFYVSSETEYGFVLQSVAGKNMAL